MKKNKQTVLVTGGLRGIGRAIVNGFLQRGEQVIIFDCVGYDDPAVKQVIDQGIVYCMVDIRDAQAVKDAFASLPERCNQAEGFLLDILINNAGITRDNIALRMSIAQWQDVLDVNLSGAFFCTQQALKLMVKQPKGYVVSISSIVAQTGNAGQANYAASKAGLVALTKSLAQEYARRNILVNAVLPGFIRTDMTDALSDQVQEKIIQSIPLQRPGTPDDVAQLVLFLTSGNADYITGQALCVTGGW